MLDLRTSTWAPGARYMLAAVALALFGLLAMHGWSAHHAGHSMPMASVTSVEADSNHATAHARGSQSDEGSKGSGSQTADGSAATRSAEQPDGAPGASLLGVCLAVLGGLLLGIALLLARRRLRMPQWLLPTWTHPVFIGRERDPPDLLRLCVMRC